MNTSGNGNGNEFQPERDDATCEAYSSNVRNELGHMRPEESGHTQSPHNEEPSNAKKWLQKLQISYYVISFVSLTLSFLGFDDIAADILKHYLFE